MPDLALADLRFADPQFLWLAPLVLAVLALAAWRRPQGAMLFSSLALLPPNATTLRARLRWILVVLRVLAIGLVLVALARPQSGHEVVEVVSQGIDIALVLDTSSSMDSKDFGGLSKIEASKKVILEFLGGLKDDRAGIVLFAGDAAVLSPLTLDYQACQRLVEPIEAGRLSGGTAIGTGLATATDLLRDSEAPAKVLILLTDGENNSGSIGPSDAAQIAHLLGMRLYTIGAISPEDVRRNDIPVDERLMRNISELTGGRYFRASDADTLRAVYAEIQKAVKGDVGTRSYTQYQDRHKPFIFAAAAFLLLEILLAHTVLRGAP